MGQLPKQTEHTELDAIEQIIRESTLPKRELSSYIMNKIGEHDMSRRTRTSNSKSSVFKKTAIAASIAGVLGAGTIGAGFVSPVMAETLKQIPGLGIIYEGTSHQAVETAIAQGILSEPGQSVTHDGITLKLGNLLYDGTRLSFVLEHEGADVNDPRPKLELPVLLADGQEIKFSSGSFGDVPFQENAYLVELTHGLNLPDQFDLTIQAKIAKVNETYEFKVPVQLDDNALVVKPDISKSDGSFSYTVKELFVSPVSTRLILDSQGEVPQSKEQSGDYSASKVYYEIVDDQGNAFDPYRFGFFNSKPETSYHVNELYAPFAATPKTVTIKPFTLTMKNDDFSIVGQKKDSKGNILPGTENLGKRTYLKDLEVTIPLQP
ncbi:Tat pathway signal protein [Paenibacillus sp. FSL H7-0357]|uniref:DUF4179 domain-containing protein n=1 Tax=Paenibacillus sp. FSL H7-0357 TaxID=1536774 RepID=UPI0004F5F4F5|nr:DUF4179 domain-containing protein [Paenibacillus sp. FSL H7-0357]AIQ19146.1 Tat pathway signal protein [Paenibacillus sp. FSL H7-0357]